MAALLKRALADSLRSSRACGPRTCSQRAIPACWVMASSRKRRPTLDPVEATLLAYTRSAVEAIPPEHSNATADLAGGARNACAACRAAWSSRSAAARLGNFCSISRCACRQERVRGSANWSRSTSTRMQKAADTWVEFCTHVCAKLEVTLECTTRDVRPQARGPEAAARVARYAALA